MLYASPTARATLGSICHYFHTGDSLSTKLGLAAASYELVAAIPSIIAYFGDNKQSTWEGIAAHEEALQETLLTYLRQRKGITIYGHPDADKGKRVPVISFSVEGWSSKDVVDGVESKSRFGCRWGHFFSKRLVDEILGLGGEGKDGVVRASLVHYNTVEEVEGFVKVLDEVLESK